MDSNINAIPPDTCGADIDVPLIVSYLLLLTVENIFPPGPAI